LERTVIKVGVVGCGEIAHRSYLPNLTSYDRCRVTAVCDRDPARARSAGEAFGIAARYDDYDRFLQEADVEMVVVLTTNPAHAGNARAALEAGKHVLCEKLLANTVAEADQLIELARQRERRLAVAPAVLVDPAIARAIRLVQQGAIGKISLARAHATDAGPAYFRSRFGDTAWFLGAGTGPMHENGVYALTTLTGMLGPAKRVVALVGTANPEVRLRVGPRAGETIAVESTDNWIVLLDWGDATFAHVDASYCALGTGATPTELFGRTGSLRIWPKAHDGPRVEYYHADPERDVAGWVTVGPPELGREWDYGWSARHLVDVLANGRELLLAPEHHRHVIEIIEAAEASSREGRAVELRTTFEPKRL
jgi:predicted dehydrogenase